MKNAETVLLSSTTMNLLSRLTGIAVAFECIIEHWTLSMFNLPSILTNSPAE